MTRVFLADAQMDERKALKVMLQDLRMDIVGEASDWLTTLSQAPATQLDLLVVDWDLLPVDLGVQALTILRQACSSAIIVVLISHLDARLQAALSAGADAFISKNETPARIAERLRNAAASIVINNIPLSAGATIIKPETHLPRTAGSPGADKPNTKKEKRS
jgi:DNA-binding NarL/FixJ family response regulator